MPDELFQVSSVDLVQVVRLELPQTLDSGEFDRIKIGRAHV